jgi:hypothetical protein
MGRDGMGRDGMGRDGMRRDSMGRDSLGRDGRSNNTNCGVNGTPGSNNMPGSTGGTNSNCPPNQSGTPGSSSGYPRDTSATGTSRYPQSGQPGTSGYPGSTNSGATNGYNDRRMGIGRDTLSGSDRTRLLPVLDQIDAAIRPVLSAAQQRTFDRNLSSWKRNHATSTN